MRIFLGFSLIFMLGSWCFAENYNEQVKIHTKELKQREQRFYSEMASVQINNSVAHTLSAYGPIGSSSRSIGYTQIAIFRDSAAEKKIAQLKKMAAIMNYVHGLSNDSAQAEAFFVSFRIKESACYHLSHCLPFATYKINEDDFKTFIEHLNHLSTVGLLDSHPSRSQLRDLIRTDSGYAHSVVTDRADNMNSKYLAGHSKIEGAIEEEGAGQEVVEQDCAICLERVDCKYRWARGENLQCVHGFCEACTVKLEKLKWETCPLCRDADES